MKNLVLEKIFQVVKILPTDPYFQSKIMELNFQTRMLTFKYYIIQGKKTNFMRNTYIMREDRLFSR